MKKWMLYGGLGVALVIPLALWIPGFLATTGLGDMPCAFGRLFGLTGFTLALFQVGLSSRLPLFEKGIGLDKMMVAHRFAGLFGFSFMLAHPVFHFSSDLLNLGTILLRWEMIFGLIALILILLTVGSAILFKKLRMKYGSWKGLHWVNFFLIPIVFIHSMLLGSDIASQPLLKYWWILLGVVYVALVTAIIADRIKARRHPYQVTEVVRETPDTWSLHFKGPSLDYKPGQFAILSLHREGQKPEPHPFTVASSPTGKDLSVSVKAVGDFTSTIKETTTADRAVISAPFGTFSFLNYDAPNLVFIAGGIGITPFMSMLRYIVDQKIKRNVLLLWGNKTEKDIAFRNELNKMSALMPDLRVVHVLSNQPDWMGEKGYIDEDLLQKYLEEFDNPQFFVCGPPVMMDKVVKQLMRMKIPENRIHFERFTLR
jgi:predicted ferric reductase